MIVSLLPILLLLVVDLVTAHVSLTFPPARQYALDFLDNTRYVTLMRSSLVKFYRTSFQFPVGAKRNRIEFNNSFKGHPNHVVA